MKIRLSKKFLLITGGVLVLCGGSGAAAVFVGTDKLLGPSYLETNGLACTTLKTDRINRDHHSWIRKYVVSDKPGDGMARVRTALRVARAVQEKEKADLVQVSVLDKAGPTDRAEMRGRAIGAQVIYIPDLSKTPGGAQAQTYSAFYVDAAPTSKGEFFGLRMDLPLEDVEALTAKLSDKADCVDPVVAVPEGEKAPAAHGDKKKPKPKGEHGAASAEGEAPAGEGEAKTSEEGKPAGEGAGAGRQEAGGEQVASKESGGFLTSVTSMIFGAKPEAEPAKAAEPEKAAQSHGSEGDGESADGETGPGQEGAAVAAHAPVQAEAAPMAAKPAESHEAAAVKPEVVTAKSEAAAAKPEPAAVGAEAAAAKPEAVPKAEAAAAEKPAEGGLLSSIQGMIFGSKEAEKPTETQKEASVEAKPSDNPPRRAADGAGKPGSSQSSPDAVNSGEGTPSEGDAGKGHSGDAAPAAPLPVVAAPPPTNGKTAADAAGAAWLAKFRQQQADAASAAAPAAVDETKPAH